MARSAFARSRIAIAAGGRSLRRILKIPRSLFDHFDHVVGECSISPKLEAVCRLRESAPWGF